jgi:hypothetical protein
LRKVREQVRHLSLSPTASSHTTDEQGESSNTPRSRRGSKRSRSPAANTVESGPSNATTELVTSVHEGGATSPAKRSRGSHSPSVSSSSADTAIITPHHNIAEAEPELGDVPSREATPGAAGADENQQAEFSEPGTPQPSAPATPIAAAQPSMGFPPIRMGYVRRRPQRPRGATAAAFAAATAAGAMRPAPDAQAMSFPQFSIVMSGDGPAHNFAWRVTQELYMEVVAYIESRAVRPIPPAPPLWDALETTTSGLRSRQW